MPGGSKKGGGLEVSAYKMKYQGSHSAFPFKSPMRDEGHRGEEGHVHPELPTSEAVSTRVAPVITPTVVSGSIAATAEHFGTMGGAKKAFAESKKLKREGKKKKRTKNIGEELRKKYGHAE